MGIENLQKKKKATVKI